MFHESSTRVSEVLTCWPPGPDERENRQPSSDAGIVSAGETSRSMEPALHDLGAIEDPMPWSEWVQPQWAQPSRNVKPEPAELRETGDPVACGGSIEESDAIQGNSAFRVLMLGL